LDCHVQSYCDRAISHALFRRSAISAFPASSFAKSEYGCDATCSTNRIPCHCTTRIVSAASIELRSRFLHEPISGISAKPTPFGLPQAAESGSLFVANVDDVRPQINTDTSVYLSQSAIFQSTLVRGLPGLPPVSASISALNGVPMTSVDGLKQAAKPWYSDQILPFDITLAGASELGAATAMKIYGVEILNEGSGVSIDDAVTEMQARFVT
jgi:hypothetical protein